MSFARITPDWPQAPSNISSLSTERAGGVSHPPYDDGRGGGGLNLGTHVGDDSSDVKKNRQALRSVLPEEPVWLTQVHGNEVFDADALSDVERQNAPPADAVVTSAPHRVCVIQTADCLPVLFCSTDGKVVGAAHAGWRGLASGVLQNTVRAMRDKGADNIMAWMGPAIGPQSFEVGQEVYEAFRKLHADHSAAFRELPGKGKYLADIYMLARMVLQREGLSRIAGGGFCTVTEKHRFYSYRRDGVTGRMASLIWIN
ncbi:MAG: peptidoglycan editing factor PgeF [Burkholderiaceae bacterium]